MMLAVFLLSLSALAAAQTLAGKVGGPEDPEAWGLTWLEAMTRFIVLWIGVAWVLAALGWLRPAGFMVASLAMGALAGWTIRKHSWRVRSTLQGAWEALGRLRMEWVFLGLLALLLGFNLFKGLILPCANNDALAWSMPIAIRYHLGHGLDWATRPQAEWLPHLSDPHNYEVLIASVLSLTGSDRITEWLSTLAAGGLLAVVGIQFRRWSGPGLHGWSALLLFASAPVFLLHMAADKSDLLTNLLILLGIFWTARAWLEETDKPGLLAIWVLFALFNVKRSGWMLAPPLILALCLRWVLLARHRKLSQGAYTILRLAGHGLAAALAMGGVKTLWLWYLTRPVAQVVAGVASQLSPTAHSFSWMDPLRFLWVVSLAPFRSSDYTVRLLSGVEWYWPEYNLIYSHFGWLFGPALLLALGVVAARLLRRWPGPPAPREHWLCFGGAALLAALLLARNYAYDGGFNTFPRFVLFLVPAVLAAGFLPLLARLNRPRWTAVGAVLVLAGSTGLAFSRDMVAPYVYLKDLWDNPGKRRWVLVGPNRTPCILDRLAGPRSVVAADCTYQTWLAPLWGKDLSREVRLIEWVDGRPRIPQGAEWVVIDNVSGVVWGNGQHVQNAEDFARAFRRGIPSDRDRRLYPILAADPTWEVVMASPLGEQALFRRKLPPHGSESGGR